MENKLAVDITIIQKDIEMERHQTSVGSELLAKKVKLKNISLDAVGFNYSLHSLTKLILSEKCH